MATNKNLQGSSVLLCQIVVKTGIQAQVKPTGLILAGTAPLTLAQLC